MRKAPWCALAAAVALGATLSTAAAQEPVAPSVCAEAELGRMRPSERRVQRRLCARRPYPASACLGRSYFAEWQERDPARLARVLARARAIPNAEGGLWRVTREALPPSYLFGTIGVMDPRIRDLPASVLAALDAARVVVVGEVNEDFDREALARAVSAGTVEVPDSYPHCLVAGQLALGGTAAALRLDILAPRSVDALIARSRRAETPLVALEGDHWSEPIDDADLRRATLLERGIQRALDREWGVEDNMTATRFDLYARGLLSAEREILVEIGLMRAEDRDFLDDYERRTMFARSDAMFARAEPHVAAGGAFLAIGVVHLWGAEGWVERLRRAGYAVTRVE